MQSENPESAPSGLNKIVSNLQDDPAASIDVLPNLGESGSAPSEVSELGDRDLVEGLDEMEEPPLEVPEQYKYVADPNKENNIMLAPSRRDDALPAGLTVVGRKSFIIPDLATQSTGFYLADAAVFVAQFRQYKFVAPKGESAPSVQI